MADGVARLLRDGASPGEHAPCVLLHSGGLETAGGGPILHHFLGSWHGSVAAGRAQAKGMVALALASSPGCFQSYVEGGGWFQVVDCFSDPLGWEKGEEEEEEEEEVVVYRDMADLDGLLQAVVKAGRKAVAHQPGSRFGLVVDSVTELVRYRRENLAAVAGLISAIRAHAEVSAVLMLVRAGCHDVRTVAGLGYLCSVKVYLEARGRVGGAGEKGRVVEEDMRGGRMRVRQRRRNGRFREEEEEFEMEGGMVRFSRVLVGGSRGASGSSLQVQFNLKLTEKEIQERARVVLPFEHQGRGKMDVAIYDGRVGAVDLDAFSVSADKKASGGEIHYLRDSDDERPDSDEDPDDDLDI